MTVRNGTAEKTSKYLLAAAKMGYVGPGSAFCILELAPTSSLVATCRWGSTAPGTFSCYLPRRVGGLNGGIGRDKIGMRGLRRNLVSFRVMSGQGARDAGLFCDT